MHVTVLFFGHFSDIVANSELEIDLPVGARLSDLVTVLAEKNSRLIGLDKQCRFAVDEEYTGLDTLLTDGCVVAALPPMSGG